MKNKFYEIINKFRDLSSFINDENILLENLYSIFSEYMNFNCLGIFFNSPDIKAVNQINLFIQKNIDFVKTNRSFFDNISQYKDIPQTKMNPIYKTDCKECVSSSELIIPFLYNGVLLGAIGIYFNDYIINDSETFNFIIEECLRIFKLKYMFAEQLYNSTIDGLTGLYNRHQFDIALNREFNRAERYKNKFTLAMIDIDHFKNINDSLGHTFGDYVLTEISKIINKTLRKTDIVYRYGGEEIAILMPETSIEKAILPAEKLRQEIEKYSFNNKNVTVSIGLADYNYQHDSKTLLEQADNMLYKAKHSGRNKICTYS